MADEYDLSVAGEWSRNFLNGGCSRMNLDKAISVECAEINGCIFYVWRKGEVWAGESNLPGASLRFEAPTEASARAIAFKHAQCFVPEIESLDWQRDEVSRPLVIRTSPADSRTVEARQ